jgi:hypothetical protein
VKLLVDVSKLQAEGRVTPEQAADIRRIAAAETTSLAINLLSTVGVIAVVAGIIALEPGTIFKAALGAAFAAGGLLLRRYRPAGFGFLGSALVLIGALLHSGALLIEFQGSALSFGYVTIVLLVLGVVLKQSLFVALSVFSIAALLGSSTGYWHAAYALWVNEPTFTIVIFGLLALAAYETSRRVDAAYQKLGRVFALLSIIWINFGFWVGSLWGDYPGASWVQSELLYSEHYSADRYEKLQQWYDQALQIPADVFSMLWAVGLLALGAWAALRNQRAVVNAVATFGAIHFYTQWFERLEASPRTVIAAGSIAVAIAFLLWRYNLRTQAPSKVARASASGQTAK